MQLLRWIRSPIELMEEQARRHGEPFTLRLPWNPPFVFFWSPPAIKEIFGADGEDFRAGEANQILESVLGEHSLLLMDGARHRRERRLMMPPFHGERMRAYGELMRAITEREVARWPFAEAFPVHRELQAITLEVILRTVFGLEDGARMARMRELLARYANLGASPLGTRLLLLLPATCAKSFMSLGIDPIRIGSRSFDLSPLVPWRELVRAGREVDELLHQEIRARRREGRPRDDVLSLLLQARDEDGREMSDLELHDEMLTLLLAGHETTATSLAWTIHRLARHPEVRRRVEEELGGEADVERCAYLDAVIKETLRLNPVVAIVGRKLARDARVGGHDLPAGSVAIACIWLAHRRPEAWPDPERFDPERFLGKRIDPSQYFPFGGGTRRCLGAAFAVYEMKVVLATILRHARLRLASDGPIGVVRRGITFAPAGGLPVVREAHTPAQRS